MRVMMFPQWFELLKSIFESFLLLLQRIQVSLRPQVGLRLLRTCLPPVLSSRPP